MTGAESADRRFEKGFCIEEIRQCGPHVEQAEPSDSQQSPKAERRVGVTKLFPRIHQARLRHLNANPRPIRDFETIYKDPTGSRDPIGTSRANQKKTARGWISSDFSGSRSECLRRILNLATSICYARVNCVHLTRHRQRAEIRNQ
jgi:hypothetical protein